MLLIHNYYNGIADTLRTAFFQVSSIMTTTGYGTVDFDLWPLPCRFVLFVLMLVGGCAGSTGGGMKVIRAILVYKLVRRGTFRKLHPRAVSPIKVGDTTISAETMSGVTGFVILFLFTTLISTLLISLDKYGFDVSFSAALTALNNMGPGLGAIGPYGNFSEFTPFSKLVIIFDMLAGRLEIFPVLIAFMPRTWKKA